MTRRISSSFLSNAIDIHEFVRFFATGIIATAGNLTAVWVARQALRYEFALLIGVATGFSISFFMSKIFAFRARSWKRAQVELMRFMLVYGFGVCCYWSIAMTAGRTILPLIMPVSLAEMAGALLGAASMTFTSYFGHRYFTYRSGLQVRSESAHLNSRAVEQEDPSDRLQESS